MTNIESAVVIIIAINSTAIFLIVVMSYFKSRHTRRLLNAQSEQLNSLEATVSAACAGFAGMSENIGRLEQQLRRLGERQDQLDMRDPVTRSHEHAIKLARGGANIDELITICGLVRDEADLLIRLHGRQDSRNSTNFDIAS